MFFFSGSAGLIYEVVWARLFSDIVGSTAVAMTSVFSAFLIALATGAYLFSRIPVQGRAALLLYGRMEIGIAFLAALSSAVLTFGKSWLAVHLPSSGHFLVDLFSKLLVTLLLIGAPTLLMGGTLPVILNATRPATIPQRIVTQLYGLNTLGAACGTLAAGFVLIWRLGLSLTLATAIAINVLVGVGVLLTARGFASAGTAYAAGDKEPTSAGGPAGERMLWAAFAFLSGFGVLGYEILWGRMAKFLLGDRTIAISALLFVFITCLGLGSLAAPYVGRWCRAGTPGRALKLICWVLLAGALLHLLFVPLAAATINGQGLAEIVRIDNEFARRVLTIWLLILPPILVLGLVFPLLIWSARTLNFMPGAVVGRLYFVNTIGAALGAVFASFALCRWTGTLRGFFVVTALLVVGAGLMLVFRSGRRWQQALAVLAVAGFFLSGSRFPDSLVWLRPGESLVMANEDEYGVQVVARTENDSVRLRNNRLQLIYDLGYPETTYAQEMAAHLSVLLAGDCRDVINIGTGYGITAGTFTLYDDVRTIDTVEILPFLVKNQGLFSDFNFNYVNDSRVKLVQGDGRHRLVTSSKMYDIISVNVLDPYLPGSSSLYTVDFWKAVRDRLRPGGVMTQLVWGRDTDLLVKGLKTVFPTVLYFPAYNNTSVNVVAFKEPVTEAGLQLHLERLGPRAAEEFRRITEGVSGPQEPPERLRQLVKNAWVLGRHLEEAAAKLQGRVHTDDFPVLEFRWAHGVEGVSILDSPLIEQ